MNIVGNVYGSWTIKEELAERVRGGLMVVAECVCGTLKTMSKSPFLHGSNSSKCFKCHLKYQKMSPMTRQRQN